MSEDIILDYHGCASTHVGLVSRSLRAPALWVCALGARSGRDAVLGVVELSKAKFKAFRADVFQCHGQSWASTLFSQLGGVGLLVFTRFGPCLGCT